MQVKNIEGKAELTALLKLREEQGELSSGDEQKLKKLVRATERELLQAADVICVTCAGAGDTRLANYRFRKASFRLPAPPTLASSNSTIDEPSTLADHLTCVD